jgi:hypothetical protein
MVQASPLATLRGRQSMRPVETTFRSAITTTKAMIM